MIEIVTVCTGNICRSPMAEALLRREIERAGLGDAVTVGSAGVSDEEHGNPVDPRAGAVLADNGLELPEHSAHRVTDRELAEADLLLAMTAEHARRLRQRLPEGHPDTVRLMRSFDPNSPEDADVADPYYGSTADFETTRKNIEAAVPGLLDWIRANHD